jgi:mercuric ion binding protein
MKRLLASLLLAMLSASVFATPKTVTLTVPDMNCPICPITVKKALTKVEGVSAVEVNFDRKEAVVTFDDTKTNVEVLTKATLEAGYPSTVKP